MQGCSGEEEGCEGGESHQHEALLEGMVKLKGIHYHRRHHHRSQHVQVIHGKEIPWNLFTPKAPYQAKARFSRSAAKMQSAIAT